MHALVFRGITIEHIQDWSANRVRDLLPRKVDLSSQ
jgi:transposase